MTISLIILTYNYPLALRHILESVRLQSYMPHEVLIADDGSTQETALLIKEYQQKSTIPIHHVWQEDKGFRIARIRNKAIQKASGTYLILTDGDRVLHPKFVEDFATRAKEATIHIGGRTYFTKAYTEYLFANPFHIKHYIQAPCKAFEKNYINRFRIPFLYHFSPSYKDATQKLLNGGLIGLYRKDMLLVNGFDAAYEGWGLEDSDLMARLMNAGLCIQKMKCVALTYHLWHPTASRDRMSANKVLLDKVIQHKSILPQRGIVERKHTQLSVCYITKNEDAILARSIESIKPIADEIIVVDSGSTDHTMAIAQRLGASVHTHTDWQGYGRQKNRALAYCQSKWILSLDADEVVTPTLLEYIRYLLYLDKDGMAYRLRRENYFLNQKIKYVLRTDFPLRLFQKGQMQFKEHLVHETLEPLDASISVRKIKQGKLQHYTYMQSEKTISKIANYALSVAHMKQENQKYISFIGLLAKTLWGFLYIYIIRMGILEGKRGFLLAMNHAIYKYFTAYHLYMTKQKTKTKLF